MAEVFPVGFASIDLQVQDGTAFGRTIAGLVMTGRRHQPYWAGSFSTDSLSFDEWSDLTTMLGDCIENNLRVDFVHPRFALPRQYTAANWPVVGDPVLVSITNPRAIVVSGLTVGLQLKRGDRLTLMQGDLRCYRKIRSDLVVTSGIAQTLPLSPRLPPGVFAAGAVVRMQNPAIRLAIVPDSLDAVEKYSEQPVSFDVAEALL